MLLVSTSGPASAVFRTSFSMEHGVWWNGDLYHDMNTKTGVSSTSALQKWSSPRFPSIAVLCEPVPSCLKNLDQLVSMTLTRLASGHLEPHSECLWTEMTLLDQSESRQCSALDNSEHFALGLLSARALLSSFLPLCPVQMQMP